jgi:hypothetical protein
MTAGAFERAMTDQMVDVQKIFLRGVVGAKLPPNRQLFAELSPFTEVADAMWEDRRHQVVGRRYPSACLAVRGWWSLC